MTDSHICIAARHVGHSSRQPLPSTPKVQSKLDGAVTTRTGGYGLRERGATHHCRQESAFHFTVSFVQGLSPSWLKGYLVFPVHSISGSSHLFSLYFFLIHKIPQYSLVNLFRSYICTLQPSSSLQAKQTVSCPLFSFFT